MNQKKLAAAIVLAIMPVTAVVDAAYTHAHPATHGNPITILKTLSCSMDSGHACYFA